MRFPALPQSGIPYPQCLGSGQPPERVETEGRMYPEGFCGECHDWISLVNVAELPKHLELPPLSLW